VSNQFDFTKALDR